MSSLTILPWFANFRGPAAYFNQTIVQCKETFETLKEFIDKFDLSKEPMSTVLKNIIVRDDLTLFKQIVAKKDLSHLKLYYSFSVLSFAIVFDAVKISIYLIENGANVTEMVDDAEGPYNLFHLVIARANCQLIDALSKSNLRPLLNDYLRYDSVLIFAIDLYSKGHFCRSQKEREEAFSTLVSIPDILLNIKPIRTPYTPLEFAVKMDWKYGVVALVKHGAIFDPTSKFFKSFWNMEAVLRFCPSTFIFLVHQGLDLSRVSGTLVKTTYLHSAVSLSRKDAVLAILQKCPTLVNALNGDSRPPISLSSSAEIDKILLEHGADLELLFQPNSPHADLVLVTCFEFGEFERIQQFVSHGLDISRVYHLENNNSYIDLVCKRILAHTRMRDTHEYVNGKKLLEYLISMPTYTPPNDQGFVWQSTDAPKKRRLKKQRT